MNRVCTALGKKETDLRSNEDEAFASRQKPLSPRLPQMVRHGTGR